MIEIRINGKDSGLSVTRVTRFTDIVELVKSSIDPDHMITVLLLNGHEVSDQDWLMSFGPSDSVTIEIETGDPASYVRGRMANSSKIVRECYMEFREARKAFQAGKIMDANQALVKAVNIAKSFFEWYSAILQLVDSTQRNQFDISKKVNEISEICKKICEQQLYQSWAALGETIENELEPKLDGLEDFCSSFK